MGCNNTDRLAGGEAERELAAPVRSLNAFIEGELARFGMLSIEKAQQESAIAQRNALFRSVLDEQPSIEK